MSRTDDLSAWRHFLAFTKSGTLTAAARVLDTEPSSISRSITSIEKALGCALIVHGARPLKLTPQGRNAAKRMETILRAHDSLMESLMEDSMTLEGTIRLSSAPGFASRQLTPLLSEFGAEHPEIRIEILSGLKEADVKKGLCDVATLTGEPTLPGLVWMSRGRNVYLPVASPGYIRTHGMPVDPAQLRTHTGYVYCGPVRPETKELSRGGRTEPLHFGQTIRSTDILAIRNALLSDMGIAVDMPLVQTWEDLVEGRLVPVLPGWSRPPVECFIVTSRAAWHRKRVRVFVDWYARAMQRLFRGFEEKISPIIGLPLDNDHPDRDRIFRS
ncbi:LysR family transcriptional regulator [Sutterella sp.]|uniref:LysR family transcriptional regulator n=1 Tax=Sutterella sp. TaxID=1981025 RepID=UPI0026DFD0D9|nr:LysR family transcriptional regulator [Sutterella sp.]MDO5532466.1 LysR family transcriptional regulator [Sutterella sp.]